MIALITPTGARETQMKLCSIFMRRQDYTGKVLWIIVDDALPVTTDCVEENFKENWTIIKILPEDKWKPGQNTQGRNLLLGIAEAKKYALDAIFIIEDDDYYRPNYLSEMMRHMKGYDVIGEGRTVYYNVVRNLVFYNGNTLHASLFQVAFAPVVIPQFEAICRSGVRFIDVRFFKAVQQLNKRVNIFYAGNLAVGIKGQPGRTGIGFGHRMGPGRYSLNRMQSDTERKILRELIGDDYIFYL